MTAYDSFIGQTFENRYTIVNVIGIGGMATERPVTWSYAP